MLVECWVFVTDGGPILNQHWDKVSGFCYGDTSISQQKIDVKPTLVKCWSTVSDGRPTINQHWLNISCLLEYAASDDASNETQQKCKSTQNSHYLSARLPPVRERRCICHFVLGSISVKLHGIKTKDTIVRKCFHRSVFLQVVFLINTLPEQTFIW